MIPDFVMSLIWRRCFAELQQERKKFDQINLIKSISSNQFHQINFIKSISSNQFHQINFIKSLLSNPFYQMNFVKSILSNQFYQINFILSVSFHHFHFFNFTFTLSISFHFINFISSSFYQSYLKNSYYTFQNSYQAIIANFCTLFEEIPPFSSCTDLAIKNEPTLRSGGTVC